MIRMERNWYPCVLLMRVESSSVALQNIMAILQKLQTDELGIELSGKSVCPTFRKPEL